VSNRSGSTYAGTSAPRSTAITRSRADQRLTAHVLALVSLAIVEVDDGTVDAARAAADNALDTARAFGLPGYHGIAPAFAVAARTADDPEIARSHALHAVELARRGTTSLGLAYVLTSCGDTLLDLGDDDGEALLAEAREVVDRCVDPGIAISHLTRASARHYRSSAPVAPTDALVEQLTGRVRTCIEHYRKGLSLHLVRHGVELSSLQELRTEVYVAGNFRMYVRAYAKDDRGKEHVAFVW